MSSYNLLIWGVGSRTDRYMEFEYFVNSNILGFLDTYKAGSFYRGYYVYSIADLSGLMEKADYLIVATQYFSEIYNYCLEKKIDRKKIIFTDYLAEPFMLQDLEVVYSISNKLFDDILMRSFRFICMNERDNYDKTRLVGKEDYSSFDYMKDYFRFRTFEFLAEQIMQERVEGCIAELGVFRGTFSALINKKFSNRELYLFDTFEGFDDNEAKREEEEGRSDKEFVYAHKQTSEQIVLSSLPHPQMCHIYKGFFPDTVTDELMQMRFAFVSIDVDYEESIYQGIKFFYPRLNEGGAIFLHDFNSQRLTGVKLAVQRFECENRTKLKKVPIADRAGTLVVMK